MLLARWGTGFKGGCEHLKLEDAPKYGRHGRGLQVDHIWVRLCDGHVFTATPHSRGLSRLTEAEVEMVQFYLDQKDGPLVPDVFAGDPVG